MYKNILANSLSFMYWNTALLYARLPDPVMYGDSVGEF